MYGGTDHCRGGELDCDYGEGEWWSTDTMEEWELRGRVIVYFLHELLSLVLYGTWWQTFMYIILISAADHKLFLKWVWTLKCMIVVIPLSPLSWQYH